MKVLEQLHGGLIVSCQAYPGEPMLDPRTMAQVAASVVRGGAVGIRAKGLDDLRARRIRASRCSIRGRWPRSRRPWFGAGRWASGPRAWTICA